MTWKAMVAMAALLAFAGVASATTVDFDDLTLATDSNWHGEDLSGGFTSHGAFFSNTFTDWGGGWTSWDGFAYSNQTDTSNTPSSSSGDMDYYQYTAITGSGHSTLADDIYGVSYDPGSWGSAPLMSLSGPTVISGMYLTNTVYVYDSMTYGDWVAKKFGGDTGDDQDWFLLTITGLDGSGSQVGTVDFYLADYRFSDNSLDYIVDDWEWVDLTSLGQVCSLEFGLSSSDTGDWGMNTPAYFALDDIKPIPLPGSVVLLTIGLSGVAVLRRKVWA